MATVPTTKTTGVTSTSFRVWLATFIPGLASAVTAITTSGSTAHQAIFGLGGGLVALLSTLGKLWHDGKLNEATLANAGSDIAAALPSLRADLTKAVSFVESDLPGVKGLLSGLEARITAAEGKIGAEIPDIAGIESVVRKVLSEILAGQSKTPTT